jgi:hypothetical protein
VRRKARRTKQGKVKSIDYAQIAEFYAQLQDVKRRLIEFGIETGNVSDCSDLVAEFSGHLRAVREILEQDRRDQSLDGTPPEDVQAAIHFLLLMESGVSTESNEVKN